MQYAIVEVLDGHFALIDAKEMEAVDMFGEGIADGARPDEQATSLSVCYGAYLPGHGVSEAKAMVDLLGSKASWLGSLSGPTCQLIAMQDVRAFGAVSKSKVVCLPFAVLIQAEPALIARITGMAGQAVTAFVRYSNMSPADNVLNRHGVFALQKLVPAPDATLDNWSTFIDRERARAIARAIF